MSSITVQTNKAVRLLSVNGETFVHQPAKLKSFHPKLFFNEFFLKIFEFTKEGRNHATLLNYIKAYIEPNKNAQEILDFFLDCGFLEIVEQQKQIELWQKNNWQEALQFHLHTNNLPKLMYNATNGEREDVATMEGYVKAGTPPPHYKAIAGERIPLEKPDIDPNCRVTNLFKQQKYLSLNKKTLGRLLYYGFGQIGKRHMRVTGEHIRKTVPSGGARHPIEAYLIIKEVAELTQGLYHYNVKEHSLTLIRHLPEAVIEQILKQQVLLDDNRPGFKLSLAILYSCVYARSMFRYRESRSYRVMQYDLGHLTQNLNLLAKAYGLNFYSGYSCCEQTLENLFGLDSYMESIIAFSIL